MPCLNIICVISSNTLHSVPLSSSASFFNNSLSTCFSLLLSTLFSLFWLLALLIGGRAGFTFPMLCADGALLTELDDPGLDPSLLIADGFFDDSEFSVLSVFTLDVDTFFFVVAAVADFVEFLLVVAAVVTVEFLFVVATAAVAVEFLLVVVVLVEGFT